MVSRSVVIGAGHNGLVAAAYLARQGRETTVLEAQDHIGGCAATVDALDARVNVCNCDHMLVRSTPIVDELELATYGLRYLDVSPDLIGLPYDGNPWIHYPEIERTLDGLASTHPGSVDGYRRYLRAALPVARLALAMAHEVPNIRAAAAKTSTHGARAALTLLRWSRTSALDVLRSFDLDEDLVVTALTVGPTLWGVSPDAPGTGLGALGLATRHVASTARPEGGSGALPAALAAALIDRGGSIRCGSRVQRIVASAGRVHAVELEGGERVPADQVIATVDPGVVFPNWVGLARNSARDRRRWDGFPRQEGFQSKIDAVISDRPLFPRLQEHPHVRAGSTDPLVPTIASAPPVEEMLRNHRRWQTGHVPERPSMLTNLPSVRDPSMRGPGGEHVLSLEVLGTPYQLREGHWDGNAEPDRWLARWGELTDGAAIGSIVARRVVTPLDYEREIGLRRGFPSAYSGSLVATLLGRPRELTRYRTPIDGLYLAGGGTFPGAGIWGASGRNVARVACVGGSPPLMSRGDRP